MSELSVFAGSAKGLARNPLGIIALFIVLIYGFAALTLGVNATLQSSERVPLVWFLVLFPLVVLGTFAWLVSCHHEKLYAPGDYKSDDSFLRGMRAREKHTDEINEQQEELKTRVRETLIESTDKSKVSTQEVEELVEKVSSAIDRATTITVDARKFIGQNNASFALKVAAFESLSDLTNEIYFRLRPSIRPYEYGHSWVLRIQETGEIIRNARMITGTAPGQPLNDLRTLSEVGIRPGTTLIVDRPA